MLQSLMEDKRLDLDLPLLSVRRPAAPPPTPSWRSAVPFYKSDLKSGPVRNPGVVPFVWEQKPGQPKTGSAPRNRLPPVPILPPGCMPNDPETVETKPMEGDNFSDAVETLSRTESFFMNCSLSGISGVPDAVAPSGSFFADPQVRDLMMGRFLPAAQAMATSSPQCPPRKPAKLVDRVENGEHRAPLPYQHRPNFVARYPDDEIDGSDGDNYEGSEHFSSKACGLLPRLCMRSSFCLLNPMVGMKVGGRRRRLPPDNNLHSNGPLSQAEDELWEAVYKHKLRVGIPARQGEGGSKSTTKSNQHGQWSDSQTLDGSSSCCHSGGSREALVEILKRDVKNGKSDGSESFDKGGERYCGMSSSHGSQQGSGILSPAMMNSVHVDSRLLLGIPHSKHSSTDSEKGFRMLKETCKSANVVSEVIAGNQRMEENLGLDRHNGLVLVGQLNAVEPVNCSDAPLLLKGEEQLKNNSNFHFLLPPPLPKTPSESWLSRTLPSVSAKIPSGQSSLGIHILQRKQGFHSTSTSPRQESDAKALESQHPQVPCVVAKQEIPCEPSMLHQCQITPTEHSEESSIKGSERQNDQILGIKPSKPLRRQIRFADVLMTPLSPRSEM